MNLDNVMVTIREFLTPYIEEDYLLESTAWAVVELFNSTYGEVFFALTEAQTKNEELSAKYDKVSMDLANTKETIKRFMNMYYDTIEIIRAQDVEQSWFDDLEKLTKGV